MTGRGASWSLGRHSLRRETAPISTMGPTPLSPFGALLTEIRQEQIVCRSTSATTTPAGHATKPGREPDLRIETRALSEAQTGARQAWSGLWSASFFLHAALLLAAIVFPLVTPEALPPAASVTKAFFVGPGVIAPPRPPPPPPRAAAAPRIRPRPHAEVSRASAAPIETTDQVVPEAGGGAIPDGEPRGVQDGVPGGDLLRGLVRALPEPPAPIQPSRESREPMKLKHVTPIYPDIAVRANIQGDVILECTVSPRGQVTDVKVLRGIPLLNAAAVEAVKHWEYTPTLRDGIPIPVIFTVTVKFALK